MRSEGISRREFLKFVGGGTASALLLSSISGLRSGKLNLKYIQKRAENMYAGKVAYDKVVRSTCAGNCTQACGWNAYVRGNTIIGLLQAADYHIYDPVAKDAYNPRGCFRGASYVRYVHGPMRLRHPYKRVGKRGEGKFKRISWDEALSEIAQKSLDIVKKNGGDTLVFFSPIPAYNYISAGAGYRLANLLGASGPLSFYDWYCDLPPGEPMTWGTQTEECEEWDWINAEQIILWGANAAESRIAAVHFITEARYKGTKVVYIGTDFTATAKLADEFISVRPGTDTALANAMIHHILENKLYDKESVKLFTDLPFLVRADTKRFLRESDVVNGGSPFKLYVWNKRTSSPEIAPGCLGDDRPSLDLTKYGINPALDDSWRVTLKDGKTVTVKTVFSLLREALKDKTPEWAEQVTGVSANAIRRLAEEVAKKKTHIIEGGGTNHWFNNDLNNRSMILLLAITGNIGKQGTGACQ